MKRVSVLGNSGSGKSTFAKALSQQLGVPVYHLDAVFWRPGWQEPERPEFDFRARELAREDGWVIDGWVIDDSYSSTLSFQLEQADTVVVLDVPRWVSLYSVVRRRIANHNKTRADMAPGCPEKLDLAFVRWILAGRARTLKTLEQLKSYPHLELHIFKSRKAAWDWLERIHPSTL